MTRSVVPAQDLLSIECSNDPYPYFAELRSDDPVHWNEAAKAWVLTRYADVADALGDVRLSSSRVAPILDAASTEQRERLSPVLGLIRDWMVLSDPPGHTRLRRLANVAFKQQRVAAMVTWMGEVVDDLLNEFIARGDDDFYAGIAYPLPATVIARMFGAPYEDSSRFQAWSDEIALVAFTAGGEGAANRHARGMTGLLELQGYLRDLIETARSRPRDDMIGVLLRPDADGDVLSEDELIGLCSLLLFAGHETTTNLLCNGTVALLRNPGQHALLREKTELVDRAVEEMLRFDAPAKILHRHVVKTHTRGDRVIKAGERVLLILASANRDSTMFVDADRFDIMRPHVPRHLGFGRGVHACIGAQMARLEARVAFPKVLERLPGLRLADTHISYKPNLTARAVEGLRVEHDAIPSER